MYIRKFLFLLFLLSALFSSGQTVIFKCLLLDKETHDPVANIAMQLISTTYTTLAIRDTFTTVSDDKGVFIFSVKKAYSYSISTTDKRYRPQKELLASSDSEKPITYYLEAPGYTDYLPDFFFDENSSVPKDTSMFYAWDLNVKQDTTPKIFIRGFYAPGESKKIAEARAQAVYNGFVKRGANPKAFVIKETSASETTLSYGQYVNGDDEEHFFKKGAVINKKYIAALKGKRKQEATQLLQAVRLTTR